MAKPGYMIFGVDIDDGDKFRQYGEGAGPLLSEFGASVLAATNNVEVLDGNWERQRATVLKFPSINEAYGLWESPKYAPLKILRESCSHSHIALVEGAVEEDPGPPPIEDGVAHYVLGGNDMLGDTAWIAEYQAKVPPISAKYGLEVLVASDQFQILDGAWPRQQMILLRFPSEEAYRGFWSDPDYLPLKRLREDNTDGDHIAFPGRFDPI